MIRSCRKIVKSLLFFHFTANLEQSGSRIPDAQSAKLIFTLTVTFYFRKNENRTKKSLIQLSHYCFELSYYFGQKPLIFCKKNADISKIMKTVVLKGVFSKTTYGCVLMCQISRFQHNSNQFQTGCKGGVILTLPPHHRKTNT